ncbi:MAG: murein biosynthesis integral membrane protein MurJ [Anaerolineales bacterium]
MEPSSAETSLGAEASGIARGATIIALGNVASRGLGFVREFTKARLFGTGPAVDALNLAITIPLQIYDLVTGGLVNSALVPAFSEYTTEARRAELWRLASVLLTLAALILSALVLALVVFAPQVVGMFVWIDALTKGQALTGGEARPEAAALAVQLLRVTLPAVAFLSLSGILTALLYSLKRFRLPAFTAAVFNASMVVASVLLAAQYGVTAMALGLLIGAALQVLLQLPDLRDGLAPAERSSAGETHSISPTPAKLARLRPALDFAHPGLRRILRAYVPILGSLVIAQASVWFGLSVAFGFPNGLSWMGYATNLYQFPLGLVGVAVSAATLPTLAAQATGSLSGEYKATLVQGLNLVLGLMIPATVGMFILAEPLVALAFEGGAFTAQDTAMTAQVLRWFLLGLSFAAVDLLLINAFYAQHDTWTPSSVGVLSVVVYVVIVLVFRAPLGLLSLMLADSLKQMTHALVTGALLSRRIGGFGHTGLWFTLGKIGLAATVMGAGVAGAQVATRLIPFPAGTATSLAHLLIPGLIGLSLYFFIAARLRIAEVSLALNAIRKRLRL